MIWDYVSKNLNFLRSRIRALRKSYLYIRGRGNCASGMANVWIRLNSSPFGDVSVPNCALRSAAVAIVDKNLSHIIATGHSFRVAVWRTIIIAPRSRRPCLSGSNLNLPFHEYFRNTFSKHFIMSRYKRNRKQFDRIKSRKKQIIITSVIEEIILIFFENYITLDIVKYFVWG